MLAAETVWRVLRFEHFKLRQLSDSIQRTLSIEDWHCQPRQVQLMRELIQGLRGFIVQTHRPKGVVLEETLRAHSEMTEFLDALTRDQARCDCLLEQAADALDLLEQGVPRAAQRCAALLEEHNRLLTSHLVREDTVLRMQVLTDEEWSNVASSISAVTGGKSQPDAARTMR
ncbi:hemerythrin domain-containing protein [Aquabacterium humicola]|uniref:hemerythrin domain-containing protein n=1 Tax=Aquabacterium humicola TaxID=3237377 RepID=UPI0032EE283D